MSQILGTYPESKWKAETCFITFFSFFIGGGGRGQISYILLIIYYFFITLKGMERKRKENTALLTSNYNSKANYLHVTIFGLCIMPMKLLIFFLTVFETGSKHNRIPANASVKYVFLV